MNHEELISRILELAPDIPGVQSVTREKLLDVDSAVLAQHCAVLEEMAKEIASLQPLSLLVQIPDKSRIFELSDARASSLNRINKLLDSATEHAQRQDKKLKISGKRNRESVKIQSVIAAVASGKKAAAKKVVAKRVAVKASNAPSPIKDTFTKASLAAHVAERAGVEPKAAKAVLAALEDTILGAVHKKGAGEFTLSGLLKITAQTVRAKKKRFGKDPFTGEERWFPAKPASKRIKATPLKKLKEAVKS